MADLADIDWSKWREELSQSPKCMAMMRAQVGRAVDMIGALISGDREKLERLRQQEEQDRAARLEELKTGRLEAGMIDKDTTA